MFPLPCPSPKQGCSPSQAHSKGQLGELTALLVELGLGKQHKGKFQFKQRSFDSSHCRRQAQGLPVVKIKVYYCPPPELQHKQ